MITMVRLSNWRAYGNIEIQLEPGTTFLIGMNGVGKSSLIEAVCWALDPAGKPDPEFVRKGKRSASVEVELLVDGSTINIKRGLSFGDGKNPRKKPKPDVAASINGTDVSEEQAFGHLEEAWGADIGFVTRTAFLEMEFSDPVDDSQLRAHLCRAYGLDSLEEQVRTFDFAVRQAEKTAGDENTATGKLDTKIEETKLRLEEEKALLDTSAPLASELDQTLQEATESLSKAEQAKEALDTRTRWDIQWRELAESARDLVGEVSPGADLRPLLRASFEAASKQRDEARETNARLVERMAALEVALETLGAAEQDCPVCRRPLDDVSRAHAHDAQETDRSKVTRELSDLDIEGPSTVLARVQKLAAAADRLGDPPPTNAADTPQVDAAQAAVRAVKKQRDELLSERGAITGRIATVQQALTELQEQANAAAEATAAFRRLGALTAARDALKQTVTEVLHSQLDPISSEVSRRWDGVFPDRPGLTIDPDGNIKRTLADGELDYASFSAGEKTVARLLMKLATLITTTQVPFCWIDEPLEHLDEKSRLIVARTLAQFGKARVLDQVFVTTYQQSLAVMVGHSTDQPRVEFLGTTQVHA